MLQSERAAEAARAAGKERWQSVEDIDAGEAGGDAEVRHGDESRLKESA
jgi:hypothetical protein